MYYRNLVLSPGLFIYSLRKRPYYTRRYIYGSIKEDLAVYTGGHFHTVTYRHNSLVGGSSDCGPSVGSSNPAEVGSFCFFIFALQALFYLLIIFDGVLNGN